MTIRTRCLEADMEFRITEEQAREFAALERSARCDIGAGFEGGAHLGEFLASARSYVDHAQLVELLHASLGTVLSPAEIEAAALSFQSQLRERVIEKYQSSRLST
ncbi:hypothetical protein K9N68_21000 [Kovacikia minuta CCNUW1]|uniref:hypothetical protein n=1 Tax=Kovacikia minuta TaxID=2931930 RepID=UPI001CCCF632|nr:hypothetical protein [Kovacikia minuta]UBF24185.1 hypothetical protein K9N68_21000 [Kovacikia minuta CCNUW1]